MINMTCAIRYFGLFLHTAYITYISRYIQIYPCISPILDYIGQHTYTTDTGLPPYIAFSDPETAIPFERHLPIPTNIESPHPPASGP